MGVIENDISKGWFVPSKSEWAAFGVALNINETNYANLGFNAFYWSSSQSDSYAAFNANFSLGFIGTTGVDNTNISVRLSTTF